MFKKEIKKEKNLFKITISIELRKFAIDEKLIWEEDPKSLIPEEFRDKVELIEWPPKKVSNLKKDKYINSGTWVYKVPTPKRAPQRKRTYKAEAKKTSTVKTDNVIIKSKTEN